MLDAKAKGLVKWYLAHNEKPDEIEVSEDSGHFKGKLEDLFNVEIKRLGKGYWSYVFKTGNTIVERGVFQL